MILYILLFLTVQLCESFSANAANHHNSGSRIVFGTAAISQADNPLEILDKAYYECGVRRFDLARTYGLGKSEEIFGQWLESRDIDRSTLSIITKGGMVSETIHFNVISTNFNDISHLHSYIRREMTSMEIQKGIF